jgi:proteasome accessory factor A
MSPEETMALDMWTETLEACERDPLSLDQEVDWVIKYRLLERYREKHGLSWDDPRLARLDLSYHDVRRSKSVFYLMQSRGLVKRMCNDADIQIAMDTPPATTRAHLRGKFIKEAKAKGRDYTVDWVHLKLNDQAQRTLLCKDPFRFEDERVDRLLEALE